MTLILSVRIRSVACIDPSTSLQNHSVVGGFCKGFLTDRPF